MSPVDESTDSTSTVSLVTQKVESTSRLDENTELHKKLSPKDHEEDMVKIGTPTIAYHPDIDENSNDDYDDDYYKTIDLEFQTKTRKYGSAGSSSSLFCFSLTILMATVFF